MRVFNPTIDEHGWQSTHTIVEIVNDDMPFLVDSVTMEVNRHGLTLHLIIHPIVTVQRGTDGTLARRRGGRRAGRAPRIVHPRRGRPRDRAAPPRCAGCRYRARARRRPARGVRLEEDAGRGRGDQRGNRCAPAAAARRGDRRRQGVPRLASARTTSRSSAIAATISSRSTGRTRCGSFPDRASASCAKSRARMSPQALPRCRPRFAPTRACPSS